MTPANEFPGNIFFYLFLVGFLSFFAWSAWVRMRWILSGQSLNRLNNLFWRITGLIPWLLGNARVARRRYWYSGTLHTMIWWGFIILQIRTLNFLLNGIDHDISFEGLVPDLYDVLRPVMDTFNILVIVGIGMAAFQRLVWRPRRMTLNLDGWMTLFFIFWLMVTDVMVNSFEFYLHPEAEAFQNSELSFLAYGFSELWGELSMSEGLAEAFNTFFWYNHLIDFLAFLCFLPYSKHSHVLTVVPQIMFRREQPTGVLQPIKDIEQAESFGAGKLTDFNWKQLLDPFSCTECGRCTAACPANITGKLLSPKHVIVDVRHMIDDQLPQARFWAEKELSHPPKEDGEPVTTADAVGFEQIWDCVTCGACMEECPVFIEHIPTIMDIRRFMVMEQASMPETAQATLMQLEQRGHPWRGTQLTRTTWIEEMAAEGTEVPVFDGSQEYLYWVGCTGALQERNVKVTKALVRLLMEAHVSFGVLAMEEGCSGDPARRLGNEYLYQLQAEQNIEIMNSKNVQKVIANCPHCYNTIKHEYPQFKGEYETVHHTELLAQLVREGKLSAKKVEALEGKTTTYHDPCYASRHNTIVDDPRAVISAVGTAQVEMPRCKRGTFCCGAGGSHMWVEENRGEHINVVRTEEAVSTGADLIAVACPFCMQMFESGVGAVPAAEERGVQVFDVAELLDMSVAYGKPAQPSGNGGSPAAPEAEPEPATEPVTAGDGEETKS
jgi:Fe-S oxidoreductase